MDDARFDERESVAPTPKVVSIDLRFDASGIDTCVSSLRSVCDALFAHESLSKTLIESFPDFLGGELASSDTEFFVDAGKLLRVEPIDPAANGACEFSIHPSDRYVDFVTAIAVHDDVAGNLHLVHGWPILSVGSASTTVAGVGGDTTVPHKGGDA